MIVISQCCTSSRSSQWCPWSFGCPWSFSIKIGHICQCTKVRTWWRRSSRTSFCISKAALRLQLVRFFFRRMVWVEARFSLDVGLVQVRVNTLCQLYVGISLTDACCSHSARGCISANILQYSMEVFRLFQSFPHDLEFFPLWHRSILFISHIDAGVPFPRWIYSIFQS